MASITYLGRNEIVVEINGLLHVGEEMYLDGDRIQPGSIGQVVQVLAQHGGVTKARLVLVEGKILPRSFSKKQEQQPVEQPQNQQVHPQQQQQQTALIQTASERFARNSRERLDGGTPWFADRDPRPRRGAANQPVNTPSFYPGGHATMLPHQGGAPVVLQQQQGVNSLAAVLADPSQQVTRRRNDVVPVSEFARGMGMEIEQYEGVGGTRRSYYQREWIQDNSGQMVRVSGMASPTYMSDRSPERALPPGHQNGDYDPFDPSKRVADSRTTSLGHRVGTPDGGWQIPVDRQHYK